MTSASISTKNGLTIIHNGKTFEVPKTHAKFDLIRESVKEKKYDDAVALFDYGTLVHTYSNGQLTIENGTVKWAGRSVSHRLHSRIINILEDDSDLSFMVNFLTNLYENPSMRAVDELYSFLEDSKLPITEDGYFLAYKRVQDDYRDFYTGKIDNSIGQVPKMNRNEVDDDKNVRCSKGLHVCAFEYLRHYHYGSGRIILVKVNPRDVVSVPTDYNNTKLRCCEYTVISDHDYMKGEVVKQTVKTDGSAKASENGGVEAFRDTNGKFVSKEQFEATNNALRAADKVIATQGPLNTDKGPWRDKNGKYISKEAYLAQK